SSVRRWIDSWVIVDTGSTDGTQEIVYHALRGVPGALYERPHIDGGANRNAAMQLACGKGDYLLFLDPDCEFSYAGPQFSSLDASCYFAYQRTEYTESLRILLAKQGLDWRWQGAVHEDIFCSQ